MQLNTKTFATSNSHIKKTCETKQVGFAFIFEPTVFTKSNFLNTLINFFNQYNA